VERRGELGKREYQRKHLSGNKGGKDSSGKVKAKKFDEKKKSGETPILKKKKEAADEEPGLLISHCESVEKGIRSRWGGNVKTTDVGGVRPRSPVGGKKG